jgi:hypothetical protein
MCCLYPLSRYGGVREYNVGMADDSVEIFRGDLLPPFRKGNKPPYRALTIPERDMLFAFYEKWNGSMIAMSRDTECRYKAYSQIKYYAALYHFADQYTRIKTKRAEATIAGLKDSKLLAIDRATEMLRPRQVVLKDSKGNVILVDDKPVFDTIYPDQKTVKTAWEIIKTELGEPTNISKAEVNNPEDAKINAALDELKKLTEHAQSHDNGDAVQGERGALGDTPEVSATVPNNPDPQPSAQ